MNTRQKSWTQREVLAAGGAALLGLAGCGGNSSTHTLHPTSTSSIISSSTAPPATHTPVHETPITLAFTGDVMFGRTVNSHMLATAPNDPYPFTYTGNLLRGFDLTIGNLECVISKLGAPVPKRSFSNGNWFLLV